MMGRIGKDWKERREGRKIGKKKGGGNDGSSHRLGKEDERNSVISNINAVVLSLLIVTTPVYLEHSFLTYVVSHTSPMTVVLIYSARMRRRAPRVTGNG